MALRRALCGQQILSRGMQWAQWMLLLIDGQFYEIAEDPYFGVLGMFWAF